MKNTDISLASFTKIGRPVGQILKRYRVLLCVLATALLYGYFVMKIGNLANIAPADPGTPAATARPTIDQATIDKLQNLQDNSVNVQSLFDAARENPFQE